MTPNLKILYVEDDEVVRENFTEILEQYFAKVYTTDNGKTALELYAQHKPDVALLDISIPYMSGLHVAAKIREADEKIQIIMLTAFSDQEKLLQAVNLQLFAYLVKPVQYKEFDKTMKSLLKKFNEDGVLVLVNDFRWNLLTKELFYKDKKIKLTNNERLIVTLLADYPTRYFKTYDIAMEISQNEDEIEPNNITQLLSRFKQKIFKLTKSEIFFIENSYGVGYKIVLL